METLTYIRTTSWSQPKPQVPELPDPHLTDVLLCPQCHQAGAQSDCS